MDWEHFMGEGHHNGGVGFEVANLDISDPELEIVIMDEEKLIVLDNNGDQKFTILLPEVETE
jgi:hypothetical protein